MAKVVCAISLKLEKLIFLNRIKLDRNLKSISQVVDFLIDDYEKLIDKYDDLQQKYRETSQAPPLHEDRRINPQVIG